jgi:hypothetical protein
MAAGVYNFTCEQGADWERVVTARDGSGALIDLTGYSARMHVRKDVDASATLVELSTDNGRITLGGPSGQITLRLPASVTSTIQRPGVYDIELTSPNGAITRLLKGEFRLDKEVTR